MSSLSKYRKNIYSQHGEDGVIREILRRLDIKTGWFVDVGAWDGKYLSNTYALLRKRWHGIAIEGDTDKIKNLNQLSEEADGKLHPIPKYVSAYKEGGLDELLAQTPIPKDFDVLNIDIDSHDWYVWKNLERYSPKIVIIETNATIIPRVKYVQEPDAPPRKDLKFTSGASFTSIVELGKEKGYTPVCHTGNIILVRNDNIDAIHIPQEELTDPNILFENVFLTQRFLTPKNLLTLISTIIQRRFGKLKRKKQAS